MPTIVEGLSKVVPWERWNCKVVATASDGDEGRKIIMKYKPHIVFCDIIMPGIDGLTMIAGLKSEFENMEIAILTGHRDFDYLQRAMHLGVMRFLLKPSTMKDIEEAVEAMTCRLDKKNILSESTGEKHDYENIASCFIVKNAMKYIDEHYNEKLTLSDVAEKTYVSQWHLSKLLNKHTEKSFPEILNERRIEEAKKLLRDSSLRIGDVAEMVGFPEFAHFSRVFKKKEGISANEYRNNI